MTYTILMSIREHQWCYYKLKKLQMMTYTAPVFLHSRLVNLKKKFDNMPNLLINVDSSNVCHS